MRLRPSLILMGPGRPKLALEVCKAIAEGRGGRLVSHEYRGNKDLLLWQCGKGHQWQASIHNIKDKGSWCPHCAGNRRLGLSDAIAVAKSRGGECMSDHLQNCRSALQWRCQHGHTWLANLDNIKNKGTWCPACATPRLTLTDARQAAVERGGELLSLSYSNSRSKLLWRCEQGHTWATTLGSVKNSGPWCPICARDQRRLGLSPAHDLAATHGGACLSVSYYNRSTRLLWRCAQGHQWHASLCSVRSRGTWCPSCAPGRREREVRDVPGTQLGFVRPASA